MKDFKEEKNRQFLLRFGRFDSTTGHLMGLVKLPDTSQLEDFISQTIDDTIAYCEENIEQKLTQQREEAVRGFYEEYLSNTTNKQELLNRFVDYVYAQKAHNN